MASASRPLSLRGRRSHRSCGITPRQPNYEKGIQAGEFILPKSTVNLLKAERENGSGRKTSVECDAEGCAEYAEVKSLLSVRAGRRSAGHHPFDSGAKLLHVDGLADIVIHSRLHPGNHCRRRFRLHPEQTDTDCGIYRQFQAMTEGCCRENSRLRLL